MSGHTPGPWVVYTPEDYDGPKCLPGLGVESQTTGDAVVWSALEPETGLKNDADARLIAAAPDLLEALEVARRWLDVCPPMRGMHDVEEAVNAAIAKARGTT